MNTKFFWNVGLRLTTFATLLLGLVWVSPTRLVLAKGSGDSGELIVKVDPDSGATIDEINAAYGTTTLKSLDLLANIYLLELPSGHNASVMAEEMGFDARLSYADSNFMSQAPEAIPSGDLRLQMGLGTGLSFADPNFLAQAPEANPRGTARWGGLDPAPYTIQYAASLIDLPSAWAISRGAGSVVAVLDTGVQLDHPELASSFTLARYDFIDGDDVPEDILSFVDSNGNGLIDEATGHGTHVAGIIHLVAPEAKIMPLRVLDSNGNGDIFMLAEAMLYAIHNGANVINLSLGTPDNSDLLKEVVHEATRNNVLVVAAAGNLNSNGGLQYPAADNCALSVTSVGPLGIKSDFANFDLTVDFAAPGESIYSTFPKDGYAYWSGTSMATPFVAGQAALVHSTAPALNPRDIATVLDRTSHLLDSFNTRVDDDQPGISLVDIESSLVLALKGRPRTSEHGIINWSCTK